MSGVTVKLPDFSKLLERYDGVSSKVDEVAERCVEEGSEWLMSRLRAGLERHRRTGAAVSTLTVKPMSKSGTEYSVEVGAFADGGRLDGYMHAVWQEFGSPRFRADPWIRPVSAEAKRELPKRWRAIMKEMVGG